MPHDRSPEDANATADRHRDQMARTWADDQYDTCILVSHDYESNSVAIGVCVKVMANMANVSLGVLDIDEALAIRDELTESIDRVILHRYRKMSGPDANE